MYRSFAFLFCGNNSGKETKSPGLQLWSPAYRRPCNWPGFASMVTARSQGDEFVCRTVKDNTK